MKKMIAALAIMCLSLSAVAMAQYTGPMGSAVTVSEALKLPDNAYVTLTGKLEKRVGDEKYIFTDGTGSIKVEIDDKHWYNLTISPEDTVAITGEIDKDFTKRKVEVDHIEKL